MTMFLLSAAPSDCFTRLQYVVVRQDGRLEWEPGENRRIHVPPPGLAAALAAAKQQVGLTGDSMLCLGGYWRHCRVMY
jgi:hypothetical protein